MYGFCDANGWAAARAHDRFFQSHTRRDEASRRHHREVVMLRTGRSFWIRAVPLGFAVTYGTHAAAQQTESPPVTSRDGMVITTSAPASDVGAAILKRGGNAVDAAVATAFALAVTHPSAGNIGGGGFMVVRPARGAAFTIDYRERAPLESTPTMYLD